MKSIKIVILITFHYYLISCNNESIIQQNNKTFKVKNSTSYTLNDISIFSQEIDKINPKETSSQYQLKFTILEDDPIISFKIKESIFIKYISPNENLKTNNIYIDSISFELNQVYIHIE